MICIFEPVCTSGEHAPFNAALIHSAHQLSANGEVIFFGDTTHLPRVAEHLSDRVSPKIRFFEVSVSERHLRAFIPRFLQELPLLAKVWRITREEKSEILIITGVTEPGLLAIKAYFMLYKPSIPIIIVFHGVLPQFLYSKKRRFLLTALVPKNIRYVVLGKHILKELEKISPSIRRRISSITHPYIFSDPDISVSVASTRPKFAFAGFASNAKGFPNFLKLVERVAAHSSIEDGHRFYLVGAVAEECSVIFDRFKLTDAARHVWVPTQQGALPMEIYRKMISGTDYLLMMHDTEAYKLVASGSALDALTLLKPIIALRSSFFDDFFDQFGDVGYLCEDFHDICKLVTNLIQDPPTERYLRQVENLMNARRSFDPTVVADEIRLLVKTS